MTIYNFTTSEFILTPAGVFTLSFFGMIAVAGLMLLGIFSILSYFEYKHPTYPSLRNKEDDNNSKVKAISLSILGVICIIISIAGGIYAGINNYSFYQASNDKIAEKIASERQQHNDEINAAFNQYYEKRNINEQRLCDEESIGTLDSDSDSEILAAQEFVQCGGNNVGTLTYTSGNGKDLEIVSQYSKDGIKVRIYD